jgi:hypothetical protein
MKPSRISQEVLSLDQERRKLLRSLLRPRPMVKGGLVERWITCGKDGCRCQTGERHGPYYYRSVLTPKGPRLEYVGKDGQTDVQLLRRYQTYQRQMARLNVLHREMVKLLWQLADPQLQPPERTGGAT